MHTGNNILQPRAQLFLVLRVSMSPWLSAEVASPHLAFNETHSTEHPPQKNTQDKMWVEAPIQSTQVKSTCSLSTGKSDSGHMFLLGTAEGTALFLDASVPSGVTGPPGEIHCGQRHKDTL